MPNVTTSLSPLFYAALNVVSREQVGFLRAVTTDTRADNAAQDQDLTIPVVRQRELEDVVARMSPQTPSDQTIDTVKLRLTDYKQYPFYWTAEDEKRLMSSGTLDDVQMQNMQEAFRRLTNAMEKSIADAVYSAAGAGQIVEEGGVFSGVADSTLKTTDGNLLGLANARKALNLTGAPMSTRQLVLHTDHAANALGRNSNLFRVDASGDAETLREGELSRLLGFNIHESNQLAQQKIATKSGYLVDLAAGYSVGDTTIHVDTGTGEISPGDTFKVAGSDTIYTVESYSGSGSDGSREGNIVIPKPGLRDAIANNAAITFQADYTPSAFFSRNAIVFANRMPAQNAGGDLSNYRMEMTDRFSGLNFEVRRVPGDRMVRYDIAAVWGVQVIKPEHIGLLT